MKLTRTANAGVLLELDGVTILMDGVCQEVKPYLATPPGIKAQLMETTADAVAFTHAHKDHYDPDFAAHILQKNGVILGPADCNGTMEPITVGPVRITPIPSRHIGAAGKTTPHASFVIEGSKCIWFTGDAAPSQWRQQSLPKPDVLLVPFAYCNTLTAWNLTQEKGASAVILLHMPDRQEDSVGLWSAVEETTNLPPQLYIPSMGESFSVSSFFC